MLSSLREGSGGNGVSYGGLKRLGGSEGLKRSCTDWLVSSGSAGGSRGYGIEESAIVNWFAKES